MRLASLAGLTLSLLVACAPATKPVADSTELGLRIASDPQDWRARRDLARLRNSEGAKGQALREFLALEVGNHLEAQDRQALGRLLLARAKERLDMADPGALSDLRHARVLGQKTEALEPEALALQAVAQLRHSSEFTQKEASTSLQRLGEVRPGDFRTKQAKLEELDESTKIALLNWFLEAGAKRQALRVAEHYISAGGRDPRAATQWLSLHRWWYGERLPPLPAEAAALGPAARPAIDLFAESLVQPTRAQSVSVAKGLVVDWRVELWEQELLKIGQAYERSPALADRVAEAFVDKGVYGARRIALVAELFHRLSAHHRAMSWSIRLAQLSPQMPIYGLAAGLGCAAAGEADRANQYFLAAAAASGDPGYYWELGGRALRRFELPLASITANRRALSLTAPERGLRILLEISLAQDSLGRGDASQRSKQALIGRVPEAERGRAQSLMEEAHSRLAPKAGPEQLLFDEIQNELGF